MILVYAISSGILALAFIGDRRDRRFALGFFALSLVAAIAYRVLP